MTYPTLLAAALALGAVCFAGATFLALRRRAVAGLLLLVGYAIPAVTLFVLQDIIVPPGILVFVSMLALIVATRRRSTRTDSAAYRALLQSSELR